MAPQGRRNEALNLAAYALGRHAHMDASNIDSSVIDLHTAAKAIGLQEHEIKATIGSGFKRGSENPKTLENDDAMPFQPSEMDRLIVRLASKDLLIRDEETRAEKSQRRRPRGSAACRYHARTRTPSDRRCCT